MKRETVGIVLLRVFCDLCTNERRSQRGEFGMVDKKNGAMAWTAQNPRGARGMRHRPFAWAGMTLTAPHDYHGTLDVPEQLPAYCRYHGWRTIATVDVLAALAAHRRSDVLTSTALAS